MSRYRSRLSRLGRTTEGVAPPSGAVEAAEARAKVRLLARLKLAAGDELTDAERAALADVTQAGADLDTHRRHLRAAGIDPDRAATAARTRLLERLARGDA